MPDLHQKYLNVKYELIDLIKKKIDKEKDEELVKALVKLSSVIHLKQIDIN